MTLSDKQKEFVRLVGLLIEYAYKHNYQLTFGEAYRTPEQAALNAKHGTGIKNSLHTQRLAIDFNLFKNGVYQTDSKAHEPLGIFWEALSTPELQCNWGGRWEKPDGNHYSITHAGIK